MEDYPTLEWCLVACGCCGARYWTLASSDEIPEICAECWTPFLLVDERRPISDPPENVVEEYSVK